MASKRKRAAVDGGKKPKLELALDSEKQAEFEEKIKDIKAKAVNGSREGRGVIYLKHIPHGFYEPQMKRFFSQFGTVTRLRLSRSKKSGNSKGFAYIEFEFEEVAKVVAETMNNYLMYHKLLKCEFIPKERIWPDLFKGCNRMFKKPIAHKLALERHNSLAKNPERMEKSRKKLIRKQKRTKNRLRAMGIDWEFDGYSDPEADSKTDDTAEAKPEQAKESDEATPPKKMKKDNKESSPLKKTKKDNKESSPPKKTKKDSEDSSPPKKTKKDVEESSPPKKTKKDSEERSPPKKPKKDVEESSPALKTPKRSKRLQLKAASTNNPEESIQTPRLSSRKKTPKDSQKQTTSVGKKRQRK